MVSSRTVARIAQKGVCVCVCVCVCGGGGGGDKLKIPSF
jgi:hypothetical protein